LFEAEVLVLKIALFDKVVPETEKGCEPVFKKLRLKIVS
jgi:hypothetical protein